MHQNIVVVLLCVGLAPLSLAVGQTGGGAAEFAEHMEATRTSRSLSPMERRSAARAQAQDAWARFLGSDAAFEGMAADAALALCAESALYLDAQQKSAVLARVRDRFVEPADAVADLSSAAIEDLLWALRALGATPEVRERVAQRWSARAPGHPGADALVALLYATERGEAGEEQRQRLVQTAWLSVLSSSSHLASLPDGGAKGALKLARLVAYDLEPQQQEALQNNLMSSLAYDAAELTAMTPGEIRYLADALRATGTSQTEINFLIVEWAQLSGNWRAATARELQELIEHLKRTPSDPPAEVTRKLFATYLLDQYLDDPAYLAATDPVEIAWNVRIVGLVWSPQEQRRFLQTYSDFLFEAPTGPAEPSLLQLSVLGKIIHNAGLERRGAYAAYSDAVLAALGRGDRLGDHHYWDAKFLGAPMQSERNRQRLWAAIEQNGSVNLQAGRIAAFAYQLAGASSEWRSLVKAKVDRVPGDSDARTAWLLLDAYGREIERASWDPLAGREVIESAISEAASDAMKLEAVNWLIWRLIESHRSLEAKRLAEQYQALLTSPDAQVALKEQQTTAEFWHTASTSTIRERRARGWEASQLRERIALLEQGQGGNDAGSRQLREKALAKLRDRLAAVAQ